MKRHSSGESGDFALLQQRDANGKADLSLDIIRKDNHGDGCLFASLWKILFSHLVPRIRGNWADLKLKTAASTEVSFEIRHFAFSLVGWRDMDATPNTENKRLRPKRQSGYFGYP